MAIQVYKCSKHGEFEVKVPIKDRVTVFKHCPTCGHLSEWVPSAPNFIGGPTTGAQNK